MICFGVPSAVAHLEVEISPVLRNGPLGRGDQKRVPERSRKMSHFCQQEKPMIQKIHKTLWGFGVEMLLMSHKATL